MLFVANDSLVDPLGIMCLMANADARFEVMFSAGSPYDEYEIAKRAESVDIIGFSTMTGSHRSHGRLAVAAKRANPTITTIMGGAHPTFFPGHALSIDGIDFVCIGEGVVAFAKWIAGEQTPNIVSVAPAGPVELEPLADTSLLVPHRGVVYSHPQRAANTIRNFMGAFGCPFNCTYCYSGSYAKLYRGQPRIRKKEPELFVSEIEECTKSYPTKMVYFQDDTFIIDREWCRRTLELYSKKVSLPYHCHVRCDIADEEIVRMLKESGCFSVTFAIENASRDYRMKYLNRTMKNETILNTAALLHKHGLLFRIENMVGLPFNSLRDNLDTLRLNQRCRPTIGWAALFQPYPNTALGERCREAGVWDGDIDSIDSSFFSRSPLAISNKAAVENLQKLFSVACGNAMASFLLPLLIRLPFGALYRVIYGAYKRMRYGRLYGPAL